MTKKRGRPTIYTEKLARDICNRIAKGESVKTICSDDSMPNADTIFAWLLDGKHKDFSDKYAISRNIQAELMFEELLVIADKSDEVIKSGAEKKSSAYASNQRLRVDTRKWYLSKVLPKKFGDKIDVTSDGKPIPLLNALHNNDSNKKDSEADQKD